MAAIAPLNPGLDEAVVRALLTAVAPGDPLPVVHFQSPSEEVDDQWQSVAYLLRCRTSGFMLGLPATEKIRSSLEGWLDSDSDPVPFIHEVEVAVETTRGRAAAPWKRSTISDSFMFPHAPCNLRKNLEMCLLCDLYRQRVPHG